MRMSGCKSNICTSESHPKTSQDDFDDFDDPKETINV